MWTESSERGCFTSLLSELFYYLLQYLQWLHPHIRASHMYCKYSTAFTVTCMCQCRTSISAPGHTLSHSMCRTHTLTQHSRAGSFLAPPGAQRSIIQSLNKQRQKETILFVPTCVGQTPRSRREGKKQREEKWRSEAWQRPENQRHSWPGASIPPSVGFWPGTLTLTPRARRLSPFEFHAFPNNWFLFFFPFMQNSQL